MRRKKRVKNKVLNTLFIVNIFSMILAGMALDSPSYIPIIIYCINALYLFLYTLANA